MNRLRKTTYWITFAIPFFGCDNYLSENPDNRVELNTTKKAAQLLTNAYSSAGYTFTEWMSDNVTYTTGTTRLLEHNQAYQWEDVTGVAQDTPTNFWEATYDAIAHANEVLAVIDELPGGEAERNAVKGEALLTRAYGHFMLVNLFAKHYNEDTAEEDPGIPYVEEPETVFIKQYTRHSVQEVYDKIEDDLEAGLLLVDGSFYANSGKYHFTKNAALAFASRFYLFKNDLTACINYSSQLLGSNPDVFIKDIEGLLIQDQVNYVRLFASPTDPSNLLLIRNVTNYPVIVGYWPSPQQVNAIFTNPWDVEDIRNSRSYPIYERGSGVILGKYEILFERSSLTSNVGLNYTIMPAFRGEEVLLNRAECYVYQNQLGSAVADLQLLVNKRYAENPEIILAQLRSYYGANSNQEAAFYFIVDERRKEFIHEGLRWFDLKRFEVPVQHVLENGALITLSRQDDRKVLQIPQAAIDVGGLEPNPR